MLMEHNKETYEQFKTMLLEHKECCLVAATGAGKTYITLQLIKDLKLRALIICHRISIQKEWQKVINKYNIDNVHFTTYQMFCKSYDTIGGYDIYIFDEAHHMGSKVWGNSIKEFRSQLDNNSMIVGLTADPNRYETKIKRQINNITLTVFNDHAVYGYDRKDAIDQGIFLPAQYVYAIFDIEGIYSKYSKMKVTDELMGRLNMSIENCLKINEILIKHTSGLSKIKGILFVEDIESIANGKELIEKTFPDLDVYVIHSKLPRKENDKSVEMFEKSDSGFIIAVDMISEGVHFSGINTIVMLRKTQSPSLYNQQIGRAFSSEATENAIIFDLVGNSRSINNTLNKFLAESEYTVMRLLEDGWMCEQNVSSQHIIYDYTTNILTILNEIDRYNLKYKPWTFEEDEILRKHYQSMGLKKMGTMLKNRTISSIFSRAIKLGLTVNANYTPEEDEILRKHYRSMGPEKVSEMLENRTKGSVQIRAGYLGLTTNNRWTPEEDEILREFYCSIGLENVHEILKNRSVEAIRSRASALGLTNRRKWTPEEDEILRKHYHSMGPKKVSEMLDRTKNSIITRASHIGLTRVRNNEPWTPEEDEILRKHYRSMGPEKVSEMLENRTKSSVQIRAGYLGLTSVNKWTPEEDEILRKHYRSMGPEKLSEMLEKHTKNSIRSRAGSLGLTANTNYTPEEDEILRKHYRSMGPEKLSEMLDGRSISSIKSRALSLGLSLTDRRRWTPEEDKILREHYRMIGAEGVSKMLEGRSVDSIRNRARHLCPTSVNKWTPEEDEMLRNHYRTMGPKKMSEMLDRTRSSIISRALKLGLNDRNRWTPEEDEILRKHYRSMGPEKVSEMLKDRSISSIRSRAFIFGLTNRNWTPEEDEIVRKYYRSMGPEKVSEMLKDRSIKSVRTRAIVLGLTNKRTSAR